ncbi:hypothetical protein KIN20_019092 [Parelaphostrongylus tenuis]|uniref:Uncharacterized protein n=1 Tax=Parelaphostrongylus tenuis TaxID=148309 RepID=A0AAD5QQ15_PARTN|nr:hypothetical protein KIN20_019092 [Parelaphostrongylus tenuis]
MVAKITKAPTVLLLISLLYPLRALLECGVKELRNIVAASRRSFTVTSFTPPVAMVCRETPTISDQVQGIAANKGTAQTFADRLAMQTLSRSAFLPNDVILGILSKLTNNVTYEPLQCQKAMLNIASDDGVLNRAVRMLTSEPIGSHFFPATATIGGN